MGVFHSDWFGHRVVLVYGCPVLCLLWVEVRSREQYEGLGGADVGLWVRGGCFSRCCQSAQGRDGGRGVVERNPWARSGRSGERGGLGGRMRRLGLWLRLGLTSHFTSGSCGPRCITSGAMMALPATWAFSTTSHGLRWRRTPPRQCGGPVLRPKASTRIPCTTISCRSPCAPPPLFPGAAGAGPLDYKTCSSFASTMFRRLTAIVSLMAGARPVNTRETFHRSHALWFKTRLRIRVLHVALKRCAAGQCFCAALPKIRTPTPPKELVCHSLYGAM